MNKFRQLLKNELTKIISRKTLIIFLSVLFVSSLFVAAINRSNITITNWREETQNRISQSREYINDLMENEYDDYSIIIEVEQQYIDKLEYSLQHNMYNHNR